MKRRSEMNGQQLRKDNKWYEILDKYLTLRDDTQFNITQTPDLNYVILSRYLIDRDVVLTDFGSSFYDVLKKSGYLDVLLNEPIEIINCLFDDEQLKLINSKRK